MTASSSSYGTKVVNSEPLLAVTPKVWQGDGTVPAILWCHGVGGKTLDAYQATEGREHMLKIVETIVRELEVPVISAHYGGNQWGNDTAVSRINSVVSYAENVIGAKKGGVGLFGHSMGHINFMNWAKKNRSKTLCVVSSLGTCDLNYSYGRSSNTAGIDSVYGGSYSPTIDGPVYSPVIGTATKYSGLKWLGFYGTTDVSCPISTAEVLAEGIGSTATLKTVSGSHSWSTPARYDLDLILEHFHTNMNLK